VVSGERSGQSVGQAITTDRSLLIVLYPLSARSASLLSFLPLSLSLSVCHSTSVSASVRLRVCLLSILVFIRQQWRI